MTTLALNDSLNCTFTASHRYLAGQRRSNLILHWLSVARTRYKHLLHSVLRSSPIISRTCSDPFSGATATTTSPTAASQTSTATSSSSHQNHQLSTLVTSLTSKTRQACKLYLTKGVQNIRKEKSVFYGKIVPRWPNLGRPSSTAGCKLLYYRAHDRSDHFLNSSGGFFTHYEVGYVALNASWVSTAPYSSQTGLSSSAMSCNSSLPMSQEHIDYVISMYSCFNNNTLGKLWTTSMPYLFPFIVEYR